MSTPKHPLREWRKMQKPPLTITRLAEDLNVQPATLSRWECWSRTPSSKDLRKIWERTGIPMHLMVCPEQADAS